MLTVVAVALMGADGRVLMQQRPEGKQHGGLWEFPGGKVEAGEAPVQAAVRELAEELGVGLLAESLHPVGFAENYAPAQPRAVVILLYACREWTGDPQCLDAQALAWEAPHAVPALAMPPLDYPLAQALIRYLETAG